MAEGKNKQKKILRPIDFDYIQLKLLSPEKILQLSSGEVLKAETINYRTQKPERDGLFCERIFGPVKDYECNCGKYKHVRYRGIVCERCGVEVTLSKVRRERMGHIELAVPIAHVWFYKSTPCRIGILLNMKTQDLERVLYYNSYAIIDPGKTGLAKGDVISEEKYQQLVDQFGDTFKAMMGAEAIYELLKDINLDELSLELRMQIRNEGGSETSDKKKKILKRLRLVESFRKSGNRPEWMILFRLPVIPPDLRPLVALDGGRFATSDLNDLYRRVISRNNRLKNLIQTNAPEIILKNEKRMLQESVDALLDNSKRGKPIKGRGNRALKSLTDSLKGKNGRFRQNLLGKRVDYSGRSVIVVGPELKIYQCGLPKEMALELFKPFIIQKLEERKIASGIKNAKKIIDAESKEVWKLLEEIIEDHPVLLNRAPTLHRLGIQAFQPVLVEGKAIRLHPLVCTAFNADFDGDQMAVHIPLSYEARVEAKLLMLSANNLLSPAHGGPIVTPTHDMVVGMYYLTAKKEELAKDVGEKIIDSFEEAFYIYENKILKLHTPVKFVYNNRKIDTTIGRIIFNSFIPEKLRFINDTIDKKKLQSLLYNAFWNVSNREMIELLDNIKEKGFYFSTISGLTFGIDDMIVPKEKDAIIERTQKEVDRINREHSKGGTTTEKERFERVKDSWIKATDEIQKIVEKKLAEDKKGFNPIHMIVGSGARGNIEQVRQLIGIRGLMQRPQKKLTGEEVIETPVKSNFKEGLQVVEYFISTHGSRKGLTDTALKTAEAGYLTRKLVDVAQDVIITEEDCGTILGIEVTPIREKGVNKKLSELVEGRYSLEDVYGKDIQKGIIVHENEEITHEKALRLDVEGIEKIKIRSVLTCEAKHGLCQKCYGRNLATGRLVEIGEAVGVMAAQSIGEPGTQLTLKTFHIGGTAGGFAEETSVKSKEEGKVKFVHLKILKNEKGEDISSGKNAKIQILDQDNKIKDELNVPPASHLLVKDGQNVTKDMELFSRDPYAYVELANHSGVIRYRDIKEEYNVKREVIGNDEINVVIGTKDKSLNPRLEIVDRSRSNILKTIDVKVGSYILVQNGQKVEPGTMIVKTPKSKTSASDITGGLPRVTELFDARIPKDKAIISEVDGTVEIGEKKKGTGDQMVYVVTPNGSKKEYRIPRGKHILVYEGEEINAGDKLCEGSVDLHDLMRIKDIGDVANFLMKQIQEVYRAQGVNIDNKHIAVIIRQMIKYVKITDPGETDFIQGEIVEKKDVDLENERVRERGERPALYTRLLMGITKASLNAKSFISAASFQETTRVLTDASINGNIDFLNGLKENVIIGNLLPAGTGFRKFRKIEDEEIDEISTDNELYQQTSVTKE
ncbi:MAG: DNA-directed RNA polymerase subunit beta' [candidate division TA06 bacterium 32_111]|uniref:DNA-directed RNA polymerase subunit beta' n=2 Tax=Bacteria candidate phyla TaxID=1783234 RepID=A0A101I0X4_UNCT6|nr:MAG: DNA-directed RNA polymerase subunit beta' [candidate division TA06 bacterium 32_111]KUK86434.1 MAG: DNA-directed RNA polymerase subunit beta' [candidate division TA06 bacterium 34_109]HAF06883.1 DNA-directed RNA polymerase subunit beta' [candidate division WOR-3 bacterium]HCP16523.1 DNA-directed RNA polymerase subunit beta' [candidate division WOR-3 bacterium]